MKKLAVILLAVAIMGWSGFSIASDGINNISQQENELYAKAKHDFDSGNFEAARNGFQFFLKQFPKSALADSALFWTGEVFYRQKLYGSAILEYQQVIENYPEGDKLKASLLKQGISYIKLGDKTKGRQVLNELINKYPSSVEGKIAKQQLEGI